MSEGKWSDAIQRACDDKFREISDEVVAVDGEPIQKEFLEYFADLSSESVSSPTLHFGMVPSQPVSVLTVSPLSVNHLCKMATMGDLAAYEICQSVASSHVRNNATLSDEIKKIVEVTIDFDRPKKSKHNDRKLQHTRRNRLLCRLVNYLINEHAIYATRNDETTTNNKNSAVDYASRALAKNGYAAMNYPTGKKVWRNKTHKWWAEITKEARANFVARLIEKEQIAEQATGKGFRALFSSVALNSVNEGHDKDSE